MQPGNHIKVWKGCYYHHGIYVGAGQVIHYKSYGIVITTLEEFSQGRSVEIVHHKNRTSTVLLNVPMNDLERICTTYSLTTVSLSPTGVFTAKTNQSKSTALCQC